MPQSSVKPLIVLALVLAPAIAWAAAPPVYVKPERIFEQTITLGKLGDADVRLRWQLPAREYLILKQRVGTLRKVRDNKGKEVVVLVGAVEGVAHYLNLASLDVDLGVIHVTLDDANKQITASFKAVGLARTTSSTTWVLEFFDNARWYHLLNEVQPPIAGLANFALEKAPAGGVRFGARGEINGASTIVRNEVKLPDGASRAVLRKRDSGRWAVTYRLPSPATKGEDDGEVDFRIEPRRQVMPALHKLYADPLWTTYSLARTKLANATTETIRNVRIRARVSTSKGQTAWSDWEETASVVYPGQSVQYPLHPVMDAAPLMLTTQENGKLSVELEYTQGDKKTLTARTARLTILGRNDVVATQLSTRDLGAPTFYHRYQEVPVVWSAFVTPNDPVVKDLKGQLSGHIGGRATDTDEGAYQFARAVYDYFRANISYSSPATTSSEDGVLMQHVNYPRDVLKAGSGTCIDLAVTYASIAEAAGLHVGVCTIPGHAFPYVVLPRSKRLLFIETTGCGKGTLEGSLSFEDALQKGKANRLKTQPLIAADVSLMRKYVSGPELPPIPLANPLKDWGRKLPPPRPVVVFGAVKLKHNVKKNDVLTMQFSVGVMIANARDQNCQLLLAVRDSNGKPYLDKDGNQHIVRVMVKPDANEERRELTVHYPYEAFASHEDGKWWEYKLEVWSWSPMFKEYLAIQPVTDRMVLQRTAAKQKGDPSTVRSILFQTRPIANKGKAGVEVYIKDVQIGETPDKDGWTIIAPISGGPKGSVLKNPEGKIVGIEANRIGQTKMWFADAQLHDTGTDKANGLWINFWDKSKRQWLMPTAVQVPLKR